jgi:hypothetical protein
MSTSCLASIMPCKGFLTLASQFRFAANNNSSGFGAFLAFALRIKTQLPQAASRPIAQA